MRFNNYIERVNEMVYKGNLGFEELVKFYDKATKNEREEMDEYVEVGDWDRFKMLIEKVLEVNLK